VPITVTALPIWFSGRQSQGNDETSNPYHQPGVREAERHPQEAAWRCSGQLHLIAQPRTRFPGIWYEVSRVKYRKKTLGGSRCHQT